MLGSLTRLAEKGLRFPFTAELNSAIDFVMEHLGTLNAFVHAADTGSFVAAGRNTGLSASTVGKAITRLEKRLGVRLFHRNTRNMVLTEEGRVFLERCRRIFGEIEAAEMEMTPQRRPGASEGLRQGPRQPLSSFPAVKCGSLSFAHDP